MERLPIVICPNCHSHAEINHVLTAQSNQNVIYTCRFCNYAIRNIETNKG
ncbi:hypothetical protein QRE62_23685 [Bacillus mycoides]|uniref:Uncharacterized protein n=1 Tax=Bacillus cereus VD048 TaxID=1053226 RepID=J8I033_BACCE|nr:MULTISPECIES: hypothetical protein [Bacillus]EJS04288.1 hypothetical protein IKO_03258 [Bacillus cereus VDM034]EJS15144.1 hypothetical protein IKS_01803 [Bacillus cereus VDM062]EEK71843.1 hypothetical protein bcere0007_36830 [Bacillus mycoides]EJR38652.1 hypothetical protein IIG_00885 [Bacillus cereus VD048]MBJ7956639.1 hypothetical protein [Bacillus cereus group sp. N28]